MKKPRIAFCPCDDNNLKFFENLGRSLRQFHSEEELPLVRVENTTGDPNFWYRATPIIASELLKEYETVIKLDADQIITGDLSDIWKGEFDVATVLNDPSYPIRVWDIAPYYNNGLVVLKSKEFTDHWLRLSNSPHFNTYQFREQDLLNILTSDYHNYKVRCLDDKKIYGEWAKPLWAQSLVKDKKIYIPTPDGEKELAVIHFGGGNTPDKGNYRIRFPESVVKRIEELIK